MKLQVNKKIVILSTSAVLALTALGAASVRFMGKAKHPVSEHASAHVGATEESGEESGEEVVVAHDASEKEVEEEVAQESHEIGHETGNDEQAEAPAAHADAHRKIASDHEHEATHETSHEVLHEASQPSPGLVSRLFNTYGQAFVSIQNKVNELERAETDNEHLRLENAHLRVQAETLRLGCKVEDAKAHVNEIEKSGGVNFQLTDIDYQPPSHLLPEQLYTLGVTYFKAHEDEKAVKIFNVLTEMQGNDTFKTAQTYLMSGVAWYRLEHFQWADAYFDRALKTQATEANQTYHAQARLWRAMVAQKDQKREIAQGFLKDLIEHHPHSTEAAWVNPKEGGRAPAASKSGHKPDLTSGHESESHGHH